MTLQPGPAKRRNHVLARGLAASMLVIASFAMMQELGSAPAFAANDQCKLVSVGENGPLADKNGMAPFSDGATTSSTHVDQGQQGDTYTSYDKLTVTFPDGTVCIWIDTYTSNDAGANTTGWNLSNDPAPTVQQPVPVSTTVNVKKLVSGLEFYALIACVCVMFIAAALWAMGSRGQNPGQELTGKRGFVVALTAAFFIGTIPGLMTYLNSQSKNADTVGVVPGSAATGGATGGNGCTLAQAQAGNC